MPNSSVLFNKNDLSGKLDGLSPADLAGLACLDLSVNFDKRLRDRVLGRSPALAKPRRFEKLKELDKFRGKCKRNLFHRSRGLLCNAAEFFKDRRHDLLGREAELIELGITGTMFNELVRQGEAFKRDMTDIFFFKKFQDF